MMVDLLLGPSAVSRRTHLLLIAVSLGTAVHAFAGDPSYYVRKQTWQDSLVESRERFCCSGEVHADPPDDVDFVSPIVRGGEPAQRIEVSVFGLQELYLFVEGVPDVTYGAATWADPQLFDENDKPTHLCHMSSLTVVEGEHDIDRNLKSGVSGPLRIAGQSFEHGLHVYAPSKVRLRLGGGYQRLVAWIGIDDWVGPHGAVRFRVAGPQAAARQDLWELVARDFSTGIARHEMRWEREDRILDQDWTPGDYRELADRYARASQRVPELAEQARALAGEARSLPRLREVRQLYYRSRTLDEAYARARALDFGPLGRAIHDLRMSFSDGYPRGSQFSRERVELAAALPATVARVPNEGLAAYEKVEQLLAKYDRLQREALLANPLLGFPELLVIKRVPDGDPRRPLGRGYGLGEFLGLPRQSSKCIPGIERPCDWDNEIAVLSPPRPDGTLRTIYHSPDKRLITDVDLHWDADRLLLSMPGSHADWHVFEMRTDGSDLRQLTPTDQPDVHFYDACYLPNDEIALVSTAPLQGVPCNAGVIVGMMYLMDAGRQRIRQVCFEQDHSYCPTVLNDGRVLYLRWDYTDTPHVWNRILFSMNPDGTGQREYYGSNSYWPNAVFYARPIPGHPSKVVGIVTGHHVGRVGELVVFDPDLGTQETQGVVQRIPGHGQKVEPLIEDKLTQHSWPKFLHPYPLSDKYFLVSCKPSEESLWGIYLVDVFDNRVLLREEEGHALVEPIPLRKTPRPPVIPSIVKPGQRDSLVYLRDVYSGPGLRDVPRGKVKQLRVFTYHFGYQQLAGIDHRVGADGPWEVKRVLGTVPVEADGSAFFRIPAKTPISVQPLDQEGKALALMRSWMTAMPGETLSCAGCHESRKEIPLDGRAQALGRQPSEIAPWYGPVRGFSFRREVQPVLDKYCVGCHDGQPREDQRSIPDLRADPGYYVVFGSGDPEPQVVAGVPREQLITKYRAVFEPSYVTLRGLIRVGGLESDLHLLPPMEFHANTSELVRMLAKGHHNVRLDAEAWDRLVTWIDLNAPCHGTWSEFASIPGDQRRRRQELQRLYGGIDQDLEQIAPVDHTPVQPILPELAAAAPAVPPVCEGWPFSPDEARRRQAAGDAPARRIDLGQGAALELVRIPAGRFVMGDVRGSADERPAAVVDVPRPFWISRCEVTNRQYVCFDPAHDSRFEHRTSWIFSEEYLGWPLNAPEQPVVRVSWDQANAFCGWLSAKTGWSFHLPTESQWEYACRAGTDTPFSFGDLEADFSQWANLADGSIRNLAYEAWRPKPPDIVPRDERFDDRALVTADVGSYAANVWGLCDMHGNAAEWTATSYRSYPYRDDDGRNDPTDRGPKVVRGGSWRDRPKLARSAHRECYPPYQRIFNVGFRVVCEIPPTTVADANR